MKIHLFLPMMLMLKNNFYASWLLLALFSLLSHSIQAQSQEKIELVAFLRVLENTHDVSFNYLNEDLEGLRTIIPEENISLKDALQTLKWQFPIEFTFVSDKNISISYDASLKCLSFFDPPSNSFIAGVVVKRNNQNIGTSNSLGRVFIDQSIDTGNIQFSHPRYTILEGHSEILDSCESFYGFTEIQLDEILITEYLTKGISLNRDNSLKIIPQEFGVLPGLINADVLHSLQYVPGAVNTEETIAQISIRGGTHDQNLFLWNGSRLYQTGHFFGMISAINPLVNHEIKVIKNGSSAFYNEGVSSVVDISSRDHTQPFDRTIQLDFLSANAAAFVELNEKSSLQIAARRSLTDIWKSPTYEGFTDKVFQNTKIEDIQQGNDNRVTTNQQLQFYDVSLQYEYNVDSANRINVDLLGIQNKLIFDEVLESTSQRTINEFEQENFLANLSYNTDWSSKHSSSVAINASFYELEAFNQSVLSSQEFLQLNQILDLKLSLSDSYRLSENFTVNSGYQLNEVGVRNDNEVSSPEVILREKRVLTTHSGIAEVVHSSSNNKFSTRLGVRANYYTEFDDLRWEPRLNASFKANNYLRLNILGEIKNQSLTQVIDQQQDFLGVEKRRWVIANEENLPIINSQQLEVGFNYNRNRWLLQGSIYYKAVESISSKSQGFQNQLEFLQINGDYQVYGAEVLVQKRIRDFNLWLNFSLMDNTYDFRGFDPQQFANNFEISQSSAFGMSYIKDFVTLSLGGRYFAGRPTTEIDVENPILTPDTDPRINFLSPNQDNLEDYFQVNFTGSYEFQLANSSLKAGFSILNLFNHNNLTQQFFRLNDTSSSVENVRIRSLELTPNAFVSYQF